MSPALAISRIQLAGWIAEAAIVSMVIAGALGAWASYRYGTAAGDRRVAQLERAQAREAEAIAKDQAKRLADAQARGDALSTQLFQANAAAHRLQENLDAALARATTGRRCLDGAALRLLDHSAAVPAPASGANAADGPAAVDSAPARDAADEWASDTDVARWAAFARSHDDECRRRLDALIDWHGPAPSGAGQ